MRNDKTPELYAAHDIYVNLPPSGSFDKTIGEALASGCVAIVANRAVREALAPEFLVPPDEPGAVAAALRAALALEPERRASLVRRGREYVIREHSLALLVERLMGIVKP